MHNIEYISKKCDYTVVDIDIQIPTQLIQEQLNEVTYHECVSE